MQFLVKIHDTSWNCVFEQGIHYKVVKIVISTCLASLASRACEAGRAGAVFSARCRLSCRFRFWLSCRFRFWLSCRFRLPGGICPLCSTKQSPRSGSPNLWSPKQSPRSGSPKRRDRWRQPSGDGRAPESGCNSLSDLQKWPQNLSVWVQSITTTKHWASDNFQTGDVRSKLWGKGLLLPNTEEQHKRCIKQ